MTKRCPECGIPLPPRPDGQRGTYSTFCSREHQSAFQKRQAAQGRSIIALAKAWRASRNRRQDSDIGRWALSEMSAIVDLFTAQDNAAGRPRPTEYARQMRDSGYRYIDRQRH